MGLRAGGANILAPGVIGVLVAAGMLVVSLAQPVLLLRVTTAEGEQVLCTRVEPATSVTLSFTHSMFGGFVDEQYLLRPDGTLVRQGIVTENAAAAEYYATDGHVQTVEGGYEVLAAPFATDDLTVRVDARGNHRLTVGTTTFPLYERLGESVQVHLEGERTQPLHVPDACGDSR